MNSMKKTFDEVVLFARTGLNPRQNFKLGQGHNAYITIKNIKNNSLIIDENTDVVDDEAIKLIHKRSQIKKGDILFASIGRMGDMYIIDEEPTDWDINESVFAFTLDTSIVRQKYFYYIFRVKSTLDYLTSNSSGSTFKSIKMNQLKKMVFDIPSLEEQDRIVKLLDNVCNVIEMRKQELSALDKLIKARFVELFGSIQEGKFEMKTLPEIVMQDKNSIKRGPFGGALKKDDFVESGYLVYEQRHAIHDDFEYAKYYITKEKYRDMIGFKVVPGDLIISCSGVTLGRIAEIPLEAKEGIINQALLKLSLNQSVMMNTFFIQQFRSEEIQEILFGFSRGSGIPNMPSMNEVKAVKFICPPIELQRQYCDFVHQVDKSKVAVQKSLDEAQLLFDSLMQKYFG